MSTYSSNGEVFGANVLYGVIVALAAAVLFAAVASTMPASGPHGAREVAARTAAATPSAEAS